MTRAASAAAAGLALAVWPLLAQQTTPTFRTTAEMVAIYATVTDHNGHYVSGLEQGDFTVVDNGLARDIVAFSNETQATTVALLLDRSGSTDSKEREIRAAARAFVEDLLPEDRASVSTLMWDCQPLTNDRAALLKTIESNTLRADLGSPIWRALNRVMSSLDREAGRRAVLILSDGMDQSMGPPFIASFNSCQYAQMLDDVSPDQIIAHAREEGTLVYAIVVPSQGANDNDLRRIARNSGGDAYVMNANSNLTLAFRSIADDLHHQYLLGFMPAVFDDQVHTLEVKVNRPGLTVRARKSYVASHVDAHGPGADAAVFGARLPWPELTDREVQNAIADGALGRSFYAACTAARAFASPIETMTSVDVVAEGPVGRIMRVSTHANGAIGVGGVSPDLRAATVTITAVRPPCTNRGCPAGLSGIKLEGRGSNPIVLTPLTRPEVSADGIRIIATYSMTDFKGLADNDVHVVVSSGAGDRKCQFPKTDVAAIR